MKISNEAKVGVLALIAIIVLILGFNFLKGRDLFNKTPTVYAVFKNLGALEKSNQVKINGLPVGTVYNFVPVDKEVNGIVVEIHLTRDIAIPRNSVAIIDGALVGASFINIEKGDANAYLQTGDTISTRLDIGLMADLKTQISPTITRVNETLDSLKLTIGSINSVFDPNTKNNLQTIIAQMTLTSAHLQHLLNAETGALAQTLGNMNAITGNLSKNNAAVTQAIRNIEVTTANLANAPIEQTVAALQATITELKSAANGLNSSIDKINTNNGTLGALMNDRKLYEQLNRVALSAEILMDDLRVHPKRYVNISLFGGRSKPEPLTSPAFKDTAVVSLR